MAHRAILRLMEAQFYIQKTLRERLDELKLKNSSFSLRAFARLLDISPASLSEFLNGKRVLSDKMIKKIAVKLSLSPSEYSDLNNKINSDKTTDIKSNLVVKDKVQLQNDQYFLVADWHYYSILCLVETVDFVKDYEWIAKRLDTSATKIKECFERLLRLGYLEFDQLGNLHYKDVELQTSEDIPNTSLKRRHKENFEAATEQLYIDDVAKRDYSFMTLSIDPNQLPEVKRKIRKFQDELESFLDKGSKKEVYEFCFQVFPRTNKITKDINETSH